MEPTPVGETLAARLARGEPPSAIFRLPAALSDAPPEPTEPIVEPAQAPQPEPTPIPEATPEHQAEPLPHDHERPRQRHFAENVLLKEPNENGIGITLHTPTQILQSQHMRQKTRDYAVSAYILGLAGFVVRWIVFLFFLLAGSAGGAAFSLLLGLTEVIAVMVVILRTWRGSMKWLLAVGNACLVLCFAEIAISISVCFKNWTRFEHQWARWCAVGFSFAHAGIVWQLGVCLINVLHTKMNTSYQAAKLATATKIIHGDLPPQAQAENAKRTE